MKEDIRKPIELVAYVAIIITAILLSAASIKYIVSRPAPASREVASADQPTNRTNRVPRGQLPPGTTISIDRVDWAKNGQTLVLALSDQCHYCSESAEFYKRVARQHGRTSIVAVLPQTVETGRKYLDGLSVPVDEIRQSSLGSLGVRGTPTLILVDAKGSVIESWVGKLSPDRETDVLDHLN